MLVKGDQKEDLQDEFQIVVWVNGEFLSKVLRDFCREVLSQVRMVYFGSFIVYSFWLGVV